MDQQTPGTRSERSRSLDDTAAPVLRVVGWLLFFRIFAIPGVMMVFAWRRWRSGDRREAKELFIWSAVISLAGNAILTKLGEYGEFWTRLPGCWPYVGGLIIGAVVFVFCLPSASGWQRILEYWKSREVAAYVGN